jgi:hypothetical protein
MKIEKWRRKRKLEKEKIRAVRGDRRKEGQGEEEKR